MTTPKENSPKGWKTKFDKQNLVKESKSFILIVAVIFCFRSTFFEPFKIPSGSMIPTLLVGDFILVNKFSYGFKIPLSDFFGDPVYISGPTAPLRGDVIVFKYPVDPSLNYIKRVVGLPGDKIRLIDKQVYVNGEPLVAEMIDGTQLLKDLKTQNGDLSLYGIQLYKTKTGEHDHFIQQVDVLSDLSNMDEVEIPADSYFVMGDNRDNSQDSRKWGFVPFKNIKGRAILVWFNLNIPWPWESENAPPFIFTPSRIGTKIL